MMVLRHDTARINAAIVCDLVMPPVMCMCIIYKKAFEIYRCENWVFFFSLLE